MLETFIDGIRESFGRPVSLIRLLQEHRDICVPLDAPKPCIAADSVLPWHQLGCFFHHQDSHHLYSGKPGTLMGWHRRDKDSYGSFLKHVPEYAAIGQCQIDDTWQCDITDVHGFGSSKSELRDFTSTDQMVEANSRDLIDAITHKKLTKNLDHREIRIIHSPGSDFFCRHSWDGRLFLMNSGGSHHFAAAKYIAARLPASVVLRGKLRTYSLNTAAIASLRREYELFVISDASPISNGFHHAMEACRATWLWHPMPRAFGDAKAILLPKSERPSLQVAALLRQSGVVDLGAHLAQLAATQLTR